MSTIRIIFINEVNSNLYHTYLECRNKHKWKYVCRRYDYCTTTVIVMDMKLLLYCNCTHVLEDIHYELCNQT